MSTNHEQQLKDFRELVQKIKSYEEALSLMYWDLRTGAPRKGMDTRSEVIGVMSTEMFKLSTSDEMGAYVEALSQPDVYAQLDDLNQKTVTECKKEYEKSKKIPAKMYQEYVVLATQAENIWEEAKEANDFARYKPYLEKVVAYNQQFIDLWGPKETRYDTLLDMYEPGLTVAKLDEVFGELRAKSVPLVAAIAASKNQPDMSTLEQKFDIEKQHQYSLFALEQMGFDFQAGRLDESVHPFATGINPGDVRITTRYDENDLANSLFSSLHEGGHALYEQNISKDLIGTPLCTGTSMGIHESQSRFWENMIGRSRMFWNRYYGDLQNIFPGQLHADVDTFYRAINRVQPSLIRTESDELTYNLHIIIRYEIEKMIFNEGLAVEDLPAVWNAKYQEYLGITPPTDALGILQDVHWSSGGFGYFPSYSLGNMYAAQMMNTLRREMPELDSLIEAGDLHPIKAWLTDKVYQYGKSLTPSEIILQITGEELNPAYLIEYLETKFSEVYKL
ncbi:carboxypeptidase M32 [Paenibacillus selenitireducens]|uniref:Metal-dependent carboxypeptidase n=1 Tax=Paenibacillus selenitireducens TaxID=1324314 RepID=A0A1T2X4D3_9BACL|nr:carboxypeptidase M32 [Paenibacillus selenitireducens]OPA74710.1 carboxypeptidase M32 [Paenibacillus selenitireducens]